MGLRLEWLLLLITVLIILVSFNVKLENGNSKISDFSKEIEFTNTTLTQVDTKHLLGQAYTTYGVRDKYGVLNMRNIKYHNDNIKYLYAKSAKYIKDFIYLDNDVFMKDNQGTEYKTQHAYYNQKNQILYITSPFILSRDKNIFKGKTLVYNTSLRDISAKKIDGIFYTPKK